MKKIILTLISVIFLVSLISAQQCNPTSCPGGYDDFGVDCTTSGLNFECVRECHIDAGCGSYGNTEELRGIYGVGVGDDNFFFENIFSLSSSQCYRIKSTVTMNVDDFDPGGFTHFNTESYRLFIEDNEDSISDCTSSSFKQFGTSFTTLGRGSGTWTSKGKFIPYQSGGCSGNVAYGLEGDLGVIIELQTANWNNEDNEDKICSGSYECISKSDCGNDGSTGSKFCSGNNLMQNYKTFSCSSNDCSSSESPRQVESCNFGCSSGACVQGECNEASDCGTDGPIGERFCSGDNVMQDSKTWLCSNNNCGSNEIENLITNCQSEGKVCQSGICVSEGGNGNGGGDGDGEGISLTVWIVVGVVVVLIGLLIFLLVKFGKKGRK